MKDDLNIRKLYDKIIEERAAANGVVLPETLKIPSNGSNPDVTKFDGVVLAPFDNGAKAFSFIGNRGVIAYTELTHPRIFNAMVKISQDPKNINRILKDYDVKISESLTQEDIDFYMQKQKKQSMGDTRRSTNSGRIWFDVSSKSLKNDVSIISFWVKSQNVSTELLKSIKNLFHKFVNGIFWVATDSKNYVYYGDDYRDTPNGEIKELKSKIYPNLTHDDIVDILMRAHSGFQISPFEKKVVWEFRGIEPSEIKNITGGYPSVAEYEYRRKLSENHEI